MTEIYLIANWKMNPVTLREAHRLSRSIQSGISDVKNKQHLKIIFCPPYPYLAPIARSLKAPIQLGAQNSFWARRGAYTGAVSPLMLRDVGCKYVILGHSERREYFKEDDALINKKIKAALSAGLRPILAIGEKSRATFDTRGRHTNELDPVVETQLRGALHKVSAAQAEKLIIAYEPVWAISNGNANHMSAAPDDVLTAIIFIRKILADLYSKSLASRVVVLYGGSTNSKNLKSFLDKGSADGALIGSSSIKADEFIKMVKLSCEA